MTERRWGGASKYFCDEQSRALYDRLTTAKPTNVLFPEYVVLFVCAAALGISEGKRVGVNKCKPELGNMYTVDNLDEDGVLHTILCHLYPDATEDERYEALLEHAEYGVRKIDEEATKLGTFDYTRFL